MLSKERIAELKAKAEKEVSKSSFEIKNDVSASERRKRSDVKKEYREKNKIQILPRARVHLFPGEFSLLGASTKGGKTTLTANIAAHVLSQGKRVFYITNELTCDQISDKIEKVYDKWEEAWDNGQVSVYGQDGSKNFKSMEFALTFLEAACRNFDLIIFDQLSYLDPGREEKYKAYGTFTLKVQELLQQDGVTAHVMFTQQLYNSASREMSKIDPGHWDLQAMLGESKDTLKPAALGLIYRKVTQSEGYLQVSGNRWDEEAVHAEDYTTKWMWHKGKLTRTDTLIDFDEIEIESKLTLVQPEVRTDNEGTFDWGSERDE